MKSLLEFIKESLVEGKECLNCEPEEECEGCGIFKKENEEEECERKKKIWGHETEEEEKEAANETIKNEKDFKDYAENKFKVVFGDKLDKDKMNKTVDGLLKDNKDLVDAGNWGELVGMLNKSFGA